MLTATLRRVFPWADAAHPLWLCGFRPFFLFVAASAPLLMAMWLAFLTLGAPLPAAAGGPFVWHAHELVFGFGLAAVAGFALTAVPEFTATPAFDRRPVRQLALLWIAGRVAFWFSGVGGLPLIVLSAAAHVGMIVFLAALIAPRVWQDPERRHVAFLWALAALALCAAGFHVDLLRGEPGARWVHAALGVLMMLIVVAMSRISMRIVNAALEERADGVAAAVEYRARPPRRNLAVLCIGLYTLAELLAAAARIRGWLAFAAAAALLNLLNDWHVGRALFRRWPLMLYGVYVLMAAGYATMGVALVLDGGYFSAGRHLIAVGAMGLNVFAVLCIAGRTHCGLLLDERPWVPCAAGMIAASALTRAFAHAPGAPTLPLLGVAGMLWVAAFALYLVYMAPILLGPRSDGGTGCEGPASEHS